MKATNAMRLVLLVGLLTGTATAQQIGFRVGLAPAAVPPAPVQGFQPHAFAVPPHTFAPGYWGPAAPGPHSVPGYAFPTFYPQGGVVRHGYVAPPSPPVVVVVPQTVYPRHYSTSVFAANTVVFVQPTPPVPPTAVQPLVYAVGTPRAVVIQQLGSPVTSIYSAGFETLYFSNGTIICIQNGQVVQPR